MSSQYIYRSSGGTELILLYYKRAPEDELRRTSCGGCLVNMYRSSGGTGLILLYYKRAAEDELRRMSCGGCPVIMYIDNPQVLN